MAIVSKIAEDLLFLLETTVEMLVLNLTYTSSEDRVRGNAWG
ncbi:MAG: hypothetical protein QXK12_01340 [Candidatus Nezhaarchaeales archaeon]